MATDLKKLDPKINQESLTWELFGTVTGKEDKHSLGSLSFCVVCSRNAFGKGCLLQQTTDAAQTSSVPRSGWLWKCLWITGRLPSPACHMLPAWPPSNRNALMCRPACGCLPLLLRWGVTFRTWAVEVPTGEVRGWEIYPQQARAMVSSVQQTRGAQALPDSMLGMCREQRPGPGPAIRQV